MTIAGEVRSASQIGAPPEVGHRLHPGAWLVWLSGGCAAVFLTSNPLYLSLAFLVGTGVYLSVHESPKGRAFGAFVLIGLVFAVISIPFNVLTGSSGPSVIATMPELSFPSWFGGFTLGGDITGESLMTATNRALGIATLVVFAGAFNASIDHFRLMRLAPRALSQLMLTLTVAIVVLPQAVAHARSVAEAQRLRGKPARGLRALPGLLLPTLHGALERSVQRAESMDARGFGGGDGAGGGAFAGVVGVLGLGVATWGAFAHYWYGAGLLPTLAIAGGVVLVGIALLRGAGVETTRLRADRWAPLDAFIAIAAVLAVVLMLALRASGAGDAGYLAYPEVVAPAFHPVGAIAMLLLLVPALASGTRGTRS